ncbi:MAG TPA: 50S ribosomal protein L24e [Candidatus Nanoarchaeia archaeon]|nr:50S ribosomal protein L24e [Candidatus Nanoarchaeia archaeon]
MAPCTFCGREIIPGTGTLYVYKTGKVAKFCALKCQKHALKLNRKPQDMKWTLTAANIKKKKK